MEHDGKDPDVQFYRWALVSKVCSDAATIAQTWLARGEQIDVSRAFELALVQVLQSEVYTKNDLTVLWAILHLGSLAVRRIAMETEGYVLGPDSPSGTPSDQSSDHPS